MPDEPMTSATMLALADEFEKSVGLYRKMPDGQMVEIHVKKVAMIQAALRAASSLRALAELPPKS